MATNQSQWIEKRRMPRRKAAGEVRLWQTGTLETPVHGRLLDRSDSGFRVRHRCLNLASGQIVEFESTGGSGTARAVWTRIAGGEAETGFHILRV